MHNGSMFTGSPVKLVKHAISMYVMVFIVFSLYISFKQVAQVAVQNFKIEKMSVYKQTR